MRKTGREIETIGDIQTIVNGVERQFTGHGEPVRRLALIRAAEYLERLCSPSGYPASPVGLEALRDLDNAVLLAPDQCQLSRVEYVTLPSGFILPLNNYRKLYEGWSLSNPDTRRDFFGDNEISVHLGVLAVAFNEGNAQFVINEETSEAWLEHNNSIVRPHRVPRDLIEL